MVSQQPYRYGGPPSSYYDVNNGRVTSPSSQAMPAAISGLESAIQGLDVSMTRQAQALQEIASMLGLQHTSPHQQTSSPGGPPLIGPVVTGQYAASSGKQYVPWVSKDNTGALRDTRARLMSEGGVPPVTGGAHHVSKWISQQQWGPSIHTVVNADTGETQFHSPPPPGQSYGAHTLLDPRNNSEHASMIAASQRANAFKNIIGNASQGTMPTTAELMGLLPEAALPLGVVAGGAELIHKGIQFATNQRAQNAQYQSIMGGSNAAAFGQRLQEHLFGLNHLGVMSGQQAQQAFLGTTSLGLRGSQRGSALQAIVKQYQDLGMSVSSSLQTMATAIQGGTTNFGQLTQALTQVNQVAQQFGVNAQVMHQAFNQYLGAAQHVLGGGSGAIQSATGFVQAQGYLGKDFGIKQTNLAALYGTSSLLQTATKNKMGYDQFVAMGQTDPAQFNRMLLGNLQSRIDQNTSLGSITPEIQKWAKANGYDFSHMNTSEWNAASSYVLKNNPNQNLMQILKPALNSFAQGFGQGLTPQQAIQVIARLPQLQQQSGNLPLSSQANSTNLSKGVTAHLSNLVNSYMQSQTQPTIGRFGNMSMGGSTELHKIQSYLNSQHINIGQINGTEGTAGTRIQYAKQIADTGQNSGIIDQLLQNKSQNNNAGWGHQFQIQENGKTKTVSFNELMSNKNYQKQAAAGTAKMNMGKGNWENLSTLYNNGSKVNVPKLTGSVNVNLNLKPSPYFQKIIKTVHASMGETGATHSLVPQSTTAAHGG